MKSKIRTKGELPLLESHTKTRGKKLGKQIMIGRKQVYNLRDPCFKTNVHFCPRSCAYCVWKHFRCFHVCVSFNSCFCFFVSARGICFAVSKSSLFHCTFMLHFFCLAYFYQCFSAFILFLHCLVEACCCNTWVYLSIYIYIIIYNNYIHIVYWLNPHLWRR